MNAETLDIMVDAIVQAQKAVNTANITLERAVTDLQAALDGEGDNDF